jgi:diacylglycerol O-acyltransferase
MKDMSGLEGAFLHLETPATPMHVAALFLLEASAERSGDFAGEIRRQLLPRLALSPPMRARLAPMPLGFANPVWIDGGAPDFSHHLRYVVLSEAAGFSELEACVAGLHATLLDRRYPLWELTIIDGLATGEIALYLKIHHAALDGVSGMALAAALFDETREPAQVPADWSERIGAAENPGIGQRLGAALRQTAFQCVNAAKSLPAGLQLLAGLVKADAKDKSAGMRQNLAFGPKTPLNVPITGERGFSAVSLSLSGVKEIARRQDATLNDIVLTICSGALRRYLQEHGGVPRKSLIATMPVSLRAAGDTDTSIQATLTLVKLATNLADPLRRLHAVRAAAGAAKSLTTHARSVIPTDFPSLGAPWILSVLASLYGRSGLTKVIPPLANLAISNVPGPRRPLFLAGARVRACWPLSIVTHGLGLNITVFSYGDSLDFGLTVARAALPDVHSLARALTIAYGELQQLSQAGPVLPNTAPRPRHRVSKARKRDPESPSTAVSAATGNKASG